MRAKEVGFFICIFFVCTEHPTINAACIARRVMEGGHDVPITKIISRYDKSIANCCIVSEFADRAYIYDNSIENMDAQLLFTLSNGKLVKQYVDVIPRWALAVYANNI